MIIGAGVAAALLIVFTITVSALMSLPYLRLAGAFALIWIAVKLVGPEQHDPADTPQAVESLWRAVRIVVVADVIMGLDNAVAVAAIANGRYVLLGLGLAISIPDRGCRERHRFEFHRALSEHCLGRWSVLGWVAGELFVSDPIIAARVSAFAVLNLDVSATIFGYQLGLSFADLAFGVLGAAS